MPNAIPRINKKGPSFLAHDNIQMFLEFCKKLGISEIERFTTIDLYEEKDVPKVLNCLSAFEGIARKVGFKPELEKIEDEDDIDFNTSQVTKAINHLRVAQETGKIILQRHYWLYC